MPRIHGQRRGFRTGPGSDSGSGAYGAAGTDMFSVIDNVLEGVADHPDAAPQLTGGIRRLKIVWSDDYDAFLRNRAERVSAELSKRIIDRPVDRDGQLPREDDLDEGSPERII